MLKITVESLSPDAGGRRRVVASMSIASAAAAGGVAEHAVTVLEAEDPAGEPPRMWTCTIRGPDGGGVWPLVRAAIDALAEAECAQL